MKNKISLIIIIFFSMSSFSQTIWTGEKIIFKKENFANWTLPENQDRLTEKLWLTRANMAGLFNIYSETTYEHLVSPKGTQWALGNTADINSLFFDSFEATYINAGGGPPVLIGKDLVMHIVADDIYLDVKILSWSNGSAGAGFSYERSTPEIVPLKEGFKDTKQLIFFPNPTTGEINFRNAIHGYLFLFDIRGKEILNLNMDGHFFIDFSFLSNGIYTMLLIEYNGNNYISKFLKK